MTATDYINLQDELDRHTKARLKPSILVSMGAAIVLAALTLSYISPLIAMGWLSSKALACTGLLLFIKNTNNKTNAATTQTVSTAVFVLFWGSAALLFIDESHSAGALLVASIVCPLSAAKALFLTLGTRIRITFLSLIYLTLAGSMAWHFPSLGLIAAVTLLLCFAGIDRVAAYQRTITLENIANRIRAEKSAQDLVNTGIKISSLIENTPLAFIEWDKHRKIVNWNPAAQRVFGYKKEDVIGRSIDFLFRENNQSMVRQAESDLFVLGKQFRGTTENLNRDGEIIICEWNDTPLFDEERKVVGAASLIEDVTARVRQENRIKQQAYYDPLTGLPNRHRLMEELNRIISSAQRTHDYSAILFIDLDHFKEINDSRGHHYGDLALSMFAQRLRKITRTEETVARLGGDEFVVLLERVSADPDSARLKIVQIAEKIIDGTKESFRIEGENFRIGCSIGIVMFNDATADANSLIKQADHALYNIKESGKSGYFFHNREMSSDIQRQVELLETLRLETKGDAFLPYFQPILDSNTNLINGLQIFLRWRKSADEIVTASEIIKVLESGSMIVDVSLNLIDKICHQVALWLNQGLWSNQQRVYFTLSLRELEHATFVSQLEEILLRYALHPSVFAFTLHAENLSRLSKSLNLQLERLRKLGCSLVVDNVGYESLPLRQLRELDITLIRISSDLVAESSQSESANNLIRGLLELTKSVGLQCIAPFVENIDTHHQLINNGCNLLQGNLLAPPSPGKSITRMLIERRAVNE